MKRIIFDVIACLALFLLCVGMYVHTLKFQLTYLDDNVWFLDAHSYLKDISNLWTVFLRPDLLTGLFYRPLIYFSFIIDTLFYKDSWMVYRITNLVLHSVNCCLIYCLLRKFQYDKWIAVWISSCFAIHPVLTQAIVWIPGRTDSLLAFFVLLSFICFSNYLDTRKWWQLGLHFIFMIFSFLTKETAVALPSVCFLYIFLFNQKNISIKLIISLSTLWLLSLGGYLLLRKLILGDLSNVSLDYVIKSLWDNFSAVFVYLGKILFPVRLSVLPFLQDINLMYGFAAAGILAAGCLLPIKKNWKKILFGILWFLIFLMPSFIGSFIVHEYRVYIPMIGVMIVLLESNVIQAVVKRFNKMSFIPAVVIIIFLSSLTWANAQNYKDRYAFWNNAVQTSPHSPLAHRNLGAMYFLDQRYDAAEKEFIRALQLNPNEYMVNNNLGLIYGLKGDKQKAQESFFREIKINPTYDNVYYNLGLFYRDQHKYTQALDAWEKAVELNPRNVDARKSLVVYYARTNNKLAAQKQLLELKKQNIYVPPSIEQMVW
ncbi:MAG: tetratricopeptide repeat protein [Candidatus Omnitrophica bacterium]|nr:tetratricopeptide repeat protein [Candidatus Omnitrophota bacterium]